MIAALAVLLLLGALGHRIVCAVLPRRPGTAARVPFEATLGLGVGVGLASCGLFLGGLAFDGLTPAAVYVDLPVYAAIAALIFLATRGRREHGAPAVASAAERERLPWVLLGALLLALGGVGWQAWALAEARPHGLWDAWAIWNVRARFLFLADESWIRAFDTPRGHPDYPLLLPLTVARFWALVGTPTTWVPQLVSLAYALGTVVLLVSSVAHLRGWSQGLLAGLVLLAFPGLPVQAAAQYADIPLGFYFLGCAALVAVHVEDRGRDAGPLLLAGTLAGLAAWTKNEGILFVAAVLLGVGSWAAVRRSGKQVLRGTMLLLAGLLPVAGVLTLFKLGYAPPNDLVAGQNLVDTVARLADPTRYVAIAAAFASESSRLAGPLLWILPVYAAFVGVRQRAHLASCLVVSAIVAIMLLGFGLVYVTTPRDLDWQLTTSCSRLLLQLSPALLLAVFLAIASPEVPPRSREDAS